MDIFYRHNPSPSEFLRSQGSIVEGSYFLAEGSLIFEDESKFECSFEVAHMEDGNSFTVAYVEFPEDATLFQKKDFEDKFKKDVKTIEGIEKLYGYTLNIQISICTGWKGWMAGRGFRLLYAVRRYEADTKIETNNSKFDFFLPNLPLHRAFSPQSSTDAYMREFNEERSNAMLDAAIEKAIEMRESELSKDDFREHIFQEVKEVRKKITEDAKPATWKTIPIKCEDVVVAKLFWQRNYEDRTHHSQPLSILQIDQEVLPEGWDIEKYSEWICVLFSIGLGSMILWNYFRLSLTSDYKIPLKQTWVSREISERTFYRFVEPSHLLHASKYGLRAHDKILSFVSSCLGNLSQNSADDLTDYLEVSIEYILYASAPGFNWEFHSTLLCALGEYIYKRWSDHQNLELKSAKSKSERKQILDNIMPKIESDIINILHIELNETEEDYDKRSKNHLNKIRGILSHGLWLSQIDQLKFFFMENGCTVDVGGQPTELGTLIKQFVATRNKLFHEHHFEHKSVDKQVEEFQIVQMMIPLMLATIFKYDGEYWDLLTNRWYRMKR